MVSNPLFSNQAAHQRSGSAILFLNGSAVGSVEASGGDTSWGFGTFFPNASFSEYAPLFGVWSILMHAGDNEDHLSREVSREISTELARAEESLDAIKASLYFVNDHQIIRVAQLAIEGDRLEWKEY